MNTRKKLPVVPRAERTCGDCFACCYVFGIESLKKRVGKDCQHLDRTQSEHHCTKYEDRPEDCSEYACAWIRDPAFGVDEHRPDKIGVVFTPRFNKRQVASFAGPFTLIMHETRPGAFAEDAATAFMEHVAGHFIVLGFHGPTLRQLRLIGPANKLDQIQRWLDKGNGTSVVDILQASELLAAKIQRQP